MAPLHLLSRLLCHPVSMVTMAGGMIKDRHVWVFLDYHCVKIWTTRNWNFSPGILSWESKDEAWSQPKEELDSWKEVSHNFGKSWCHLVGKTEAKTRMGQWWVRPHLGQDCEAVHNSCSLFKSNPYVRCLRMDWWWVGEILDSLYFSPSSQSGHNEQIPLFCFSWLSI